jgi:hypothetical protein
MSGDPKEMKKLFFVWPLIFIIVANLCFGQEQAELLSEGFMLSGVEGTVLCDDAQQEWLFKLSSDVNDSFSRVNADTQLPLLPSSALERLCSDVNERPKPYYKLWGRVTRYKNQNFVFPSSFFPLAKAKNIEPEVTSEQTNSADEQPDKQLKVSESDDVIVIPKDVLKKLSSRNVVRTETVRERFEVQIDTIISDRRAVLKKMSEENFVFVLDSIGRNTSEVSLKVLPSQALELAEHVQASIPENIHFKISGLLTKYKEEYYLLLQRANRVYSHQNFAR